MSSSKRADVTENCALLTSRHRRFRNSGGGDYLQRLQGSGRRHGVRRKLKLIPFATPEDVIYFDAIDLGVLFAVDSKMLHLYTWVLVLVPIQ